MCKVVPYTELIAGKIKALAERRSPATRDLYDVYRASQAMAEMIEAVASFMKRLGALTTRQHEYIDLMAKSGTYRPELLFARWPAVLERAEVSPAAAWKVQNLRKRPAQK